MGTPITKAAKIVCDSGGQVDLSKVKNKIQVGGNDVVVATDVGPTKTTITGCSGHPSGNGPMCQYITKWNISLNTLKVDGPPSVPVVGSALPPTQVALSDVPAAIITCTDAGNTKLFAS